MMFFNSVWWCKKHVQCAYTNVEQYSDDLHYDKILGVIIICFLTWSGQQGHIELQPFVNLLLKAINTP